jgi:hypothetical protein
VSLPAGSLAVEPGFGRVSVGVGDIRGVDLDCLAYLVELARLVELIRTFRLTWTRSVSIQYRTVTADVRGTKRFSLSAGQLRLLSRDATRTRDAPKEGPRRSTPQGTDPAVGIAFVSGAADFGTATCRSVWQG